MAEGDDFSENDLKLRHLHHALASTMRAFQGRIVDNLIVAKKARHSDLTTQNSFYVEVSRAYDHAKLVIRELDEVGR